MRLVLASHHGGGLYAKRQGMIEPVLADMKFNRRIERFRRRGRGAGAPNGASSAPPTTRSSSGATTAPRHRPEPDGGRRTAGR
jgi:hypothetical protein